MPARPAPAALLVALAALPLSATAATTFAPLAHGFDFDLEGIHYVYPRGLSADGSTIVGVYNHVFDIEDQERPFRVAGGVRSEPDPLCFDFPFFRVTGVTPDGSLMYGNAFRCGINPDNPGAGHREAAYVQTGSAVTAMGFLPGGQSWMSEDSSIVLDASSDGSVLIGHSPTLTPQYEAEWPEGLVNPFRWTAQTGMVDLGYPSYAQGVSVVDASSDGSTILCSSLGLFFDDQGNFETPFMGLIWTQANGYQRFTPPGFDAAYTDVLPAGMTDDGSAVVGLTLSALWSPGRPNPPIAFVWRRGEPACTIIPARPDLNLPYIRISSMTPDASIVLGVVYGGPGTGDQPFIWDSTRGTRTLDEYLTRRGIDPQTLGWPTLSWGIISDNGRVIVGSGVRQGPIEQHTDAWVITTDGLCRADFDDNGQVQVADIFSFLRAWFAGDGRADFDASTNVQVADIFAFLRAWFAGC